jgi:hypothetical protein
VGAEGRALAPRSVSKLLRAASGTYALAHRRRRFARFAVGNRLHRDRRHFDDEIDAIARA